MSKIRELLMEYLERWEPSHGPMWVYHTFHLGLTGYIALQVAQLQGTNPAEAEAFVSTLSVLIYAPAFIWYGTPVAEMVLDRILPDFDLEVEDGG